MPRCAFQIAGNLALLLSVAGHAPLGAQAGARVPVTGETVAAALTGSGLRVSADQIEVPGSLSTVSADPQFHVTGAELLPDGSLRVRVACRLPGDCQPFLAKVRSSSAPGELMDFVKFHKGRQATAPLQSRAAGRLLAGQHATLLLEDYRMRITVPVLVIDSGVPGTEVRVSSLDRKQTFRAVVADDGTVRGTLP